MQPSYQVSQITAAQIDPAFLLVGPVVPKLGLDGWRDFCRHVLAYARQAAGQDHIVVAANRRGYVQGLGVYAVRSHPLHGRMLDVSLFVVASAADEGGVAGDLLSYLKAIARSETCDVLRIWSLEQEDGSSRLKGSAPEAPECGVMMILDANTSREP